jgi:hypothetical protein
MMNSHRKSRFSGILKEIKEGGDQERPGGDPLREDEKSWSRLRYLAANRDKW